MDKNKKVILIGLIAIILLIIIFAFGIKSGEKENNMKKPNNQIEQIVTITEDGITKLNITKIVDGLKFSDIEIEMTSNRECEIRVNVENTKTEMEEAHVVRIIATNENGLREVFAGQLASIPSGENRVLISTIRKDLTKATNVEFEIIE